MTRSTLAIASTALAFAMLAFMLCLGAALPARMLLPVHWGLDGEPDIFAQKWIALLLPPLLILANGLFFFALPALEPRKAGLERSQGLYLICWVAVLLIHVARALAEIAHALAWDFAVERMIVASIAIALILIGNQLSKSRSMYLLGIVTPWTLASEDVWIRTHLLAGKLVALGGIAILAAALCALPDASVRAIALTALCSMAVIPIAYSYALWRREQRRILSIFLQPGAEAQRPAEDLRAAGIGYVLSIVALTAIVIAIIAPLVEAEGIAHLPAILLRLLRDGLPYVFAP